ncbi:hypothetical protein [Clostridium pasteurianum]|uniref:Uncharacterized protein n=1 Tax=Clostridium pasteurianum BC1 TaxID=86416 RepID=R4KGP6_CLOPA|nr:hypothetical protein [Clostridium pasteurianum]AGK98780.1 hypothetical protein Clopa_4039 [Clostridium pasteurianum BC1]
MKIGTKELFSTVELKNILTKFQNKINKQLEKKSKYEEEIKTLQNKLEKAIEKNILEGNNEVEITRITARITNTKILLNIVDDSINNIKKVRAERLAEELPAAKYSDEVPDMIERNREEANAVANRGKVAEEMVQIADCNKLEDVDLENFLKALKVSE